MQSIFCNHYSVNDAADRGVKLHSDNATILTENEEQRASLLQAVEKYRRQYVDFEKSTLALMTNERCYVLLLSIS